jgi:hypothetical protein
VQFHLQTNCRSSFWACCCCCGCYCRDTIVSLRCSDDWNLCRLVVVVVPDDSRRHQQLLLLCRCTGIVGNARVHHGPNRDPFPQGHKGVIPVPTAPGGNPPCGLLYGIRGIYAEHAGVDERP